MKVVYISKEIVEVMEGGEILLYTPEEFRKRFKQEPKRGYIR
jgi:hypothetical protein